MKNVPENELFSAYLDGELTAEEERRVEQLLAESDSARQLMDELRSLSAVLQSLPREQAPIDFSERVLQEVRHRVLDDAPLGTADGPRPAVSVEPSDDEALPSITFGTVLRRAVRPRNLIWAIVAASVAMVFYLADVNDRVGERPQDLALRQIPSEEAETVPEMEAAVEETLPAPESLAVTEDAAAGATAETMEAEAAPAITRIEVAPAEPAIAEVTNVPRESEYVAAEAPIEPIDIVCVVDSRVDPEELASMVVVRRNAVPDHALPGEGWEFAAETSPPAGKRPLVKIERQQVGAQQEMVVEMTANAAQLQAVLDELGVRPEVEEIQVPPPVESLARADAQRRLRVVPRERLAMTRRRAVPQAAAYGAMADATAPSAPQPTTFGQSAPGALPGGRGSEPAEGAAPSAGALGGVRAMRTFGAAPQAEALAEEAIPAEEKPAAAQAARTAANADEQRAETGAGATAYGGESQVRAKAATPRLVKQDALSQIQAMPKAQVPVRLVFVQGLPTASSDRSGTKRAPQSAEDETSAQPADSDR
ncbi:hypothetical protein JCM19992_08750 [Thermostilla marina]